MTDAGMPVTCLGTARNAGMAKLLYDGPAARGGRRGSGCPPVGRGAPASSSLAIMLLSCHTPSMANLQVKNIPDALHDRLRAHARESNSTMGAVVLAAVERELAGWEWRKRLAQRPQTDLGMEAVELLWEERSLGDQERD